MAIASSTEYLGQITSAIDPKPLSLDVNLCKGEPVKLFVASENKLKVDAAKSAVEKWLKGNAETLAIKGFNAESKIKEQPVGKETTMQGAQNRITHLKELAKATSEPGLQLFVSMENGLMPEEVAELKNKEKFLDTETKKAWIDRCYVIVEIFHNKEKVAEGSAFSRGVTTPMDAVEAAKATEWNKTAGSFIEKIYGFNSKDWHTKMAGVGRQELMEETITTALGKLQ